MARYIYIDTNGQQKSIDAPSAEVALSTAPGIAPTSGVFLETQARSGVLPAPSPVQAALTPAGIDLAAIQEVSNIVAPPAQPARPTQAGAFVAPSVNVVSYRDNPDGTTTNFYSDGTSETGKLVVGANGQATFTPNPTTGIGRIGSDITATKNEIATLEERIANRSTQRTSELEGAGVFGDVRRLNELNATLRAAQDRQIEVPLEERQNLRGRGATFTEFEQATRPELERAALQELTTSRASSRLTDSINTNINLIDTRLKAEAERDDLIYTKKQDYLKTLETGYANILTEEQKLGLEDRKFANELTRDAITAEREAKQKQLDLAAEKGATPAELERLFNAPVEDVYSWNANKALQLGQEDPTKVGVEQSAIDIVGLIDDVLSDEKGLAASVGSTWLGRTRANSLFGIPGALLSTGIEQGTGFEIDADNISSFRGSASKLIADQVLTNLIAVKSRGASFGALSESELSMLERAATELRPVKKDGEYTGQFAVSEEKFKEILDTMQVATMKTYLASRLGANAYRNAGYINADVADIKKAYNALLETQPNPSASTNFYEEDVAPALDVVRREEGLRTDAYQDSTGKWTIGYGNTTIGGRPVKQGDSITKDQAETMLRDAVATRYSTGANAVGNTTTPAQKAALISFEYNLGPGVWNTPTGQRILSLVSGGSYAQAGQLMQQYNKSRNPATGQLETNPVLTARRAREAALLLG